MQLSAVRQVPIQKGHPMSVDPGPPTQLRAQNAKGKNVNKVRRAGPPRTQLRQKIARRKTVLILCLRTSQRT